MTINPEIRTTNHETTITNPNYELQSFMQNKPNFLNNQMNITFYLKTCYEQKRPFRPTAKQTQSNPIKPKQTQSHPWFWLKNWLRIKQNQKQSTQLCIIFTNLYKKILIFKQIHPLFLRFVLIFCRNFVITVDR